ncbi:probable glutamate receptor [Bacillus rossius redtenbacheri]|uniref:probable glutamate receptor n=1 Tax=Bacillus rossius redtenbacheri TaxID=93214 RepID=UPI002FDCEF4D
MLVAVAPVFLSIVTCALPARTMQPRRSLKTNSQGWVFVGNSTAVNKPVFQRDFGGITLNITAFKVGYLLDFEDNDTKIIGVYGDIWYTLAEYLNFTLRVKRLAKNVVGMPNPGTTWDGLMGYLHRGETHVVPRVFMNSDRARVAHFVHPFARTGYQLYMRSGRPSVSWWWVVLPFSPPLWLAVLATVLAVAGATHACDRLARDRLPGRPHDLDFWRDLLHVCGFFCLQGHSWHQGWAGGRLLLVATLTTACVLYQAFCAQLITSLTFRASWEPPFTSLEQLAAGGHDYKLAVLGGSHVHACFKTATDEHLARVWRKYTVVVTNISDGVQRVCRSHTAFLSLPENVYAANPPCSLEIVSRQKFFPTWISSGIIRNFPHQKVLDISFIKIQETGVMKRMVLRHIAPHRKRHRRQGGARSSEMELEHIQPVLLVYCTAVAASLALLCAEVALASRRAQVPATRGSKVDCRTLSWTK